MKLASSNVTRPLARHLNHAGFILLPVVLAMTLIAAIAFLLNRDNGMNINMVGKQSDTDRAYYIAEAGLQAVNADIQSPSKSCAGGFPTSASPVSFGGGSYEAYASAASGSTVGITSKGTYKGTSVTLTRQNVIVYQANSSSYNVQPNALAGIDSYLSFGDSSPNDTASTMGLSAFKRPVLEFDLTKFPIATLPTSANISLYVGSDMSADLYRINKNWAASNANWTSRTSSASWAAQGGDFHNDAFGSLSTNSSPNWVNDDMSDIVSAWMNDRYLNQGLLIKSNSLFTDDFTSSDSTDVVHHPKLALTYYLPCGNTADTFIDQNSLLSNNGGASTLKLESDAASQEKRILMQFDTSAIPADTVITTAKLRMYVSGIASATASAKDMRAIGMHQSWVAGAGVNVNKTCGTEESVIGSAGASWTYSDKCKKWSPVLSPTPDSTNKWVGMAGMPTSRYGHSVVAVGNKIYAIGGTRDGVNYLNTVEEYDLNTNTWRSRANMTTARGFAAAVTLDGKIYVIGGTDNTNGTNARKRLQMYDPATNTWTAKADILTPRNGLGAAVVNGKIYAIGGTDDKWPYNGNYQKKCEEYNPATNSWVGKADMLDERSVLAVQAVGNKIYAIGGYDGSTLKKVQIYNPATNTWDNSKPDLTNRVDSMASAVIGNKIYLIGGYKSGVLDRVISYDVISLVNKVEETLPEARQNLGAALVNDMIFTIGGRTASTWTTDVAYHSRLDIFESAATDVATGVTPAAGFSNGWVEFDVTKLVQGWVDGVRFNNGVIIYSNVADKLSVNSLENSSNNPQLIVTY